MNGETPVEIKIGITILPTRMYIPRPEPPVKTTAVIKKKIIAETSALPPPSSAAFLTMPLVIPVLLRI